jgi:hypothetical protein
MRVALGTLNLTDFQARAIQLALTTKQSDYYPRLPKAATREACRQFMLDRGNEGLAKAEQDLSYLEDRRAVSWRRGQPTLEQLKERASA